MEVLSYNIEVPISYDHYLSLRNEIIRQEMLASRLGLTDILDYYADKRVFYNNVIRVIKREY